MLNERPYTLTHKTESENWSNKTQPSNYRNCTMWCMLSSQILWIRKHVCFGSKWIWKYNLNSSVMGLSVHMDSNIVNIIFLKMTITLTCVRMYNHHQHRKKLTYIHHNCWNTYNRDKYVKMNGIWQFWHNGIKKVDFISIIVGNLHIVYLSHCYILWYLQLNTLYSCEILI